MIFSIRLDGCTPEAFGFPGCFVLRRPGRLNIHTFVTICLLDGYLLPSTDVLKCEHGQGGVCAMFGYIRPDAGQLRVCEYETYRAVYCGICHALKEHFGTLSTLSLNYDFTFAALLGLALKPGFRDTKASPAPPTPFTSGSGSGWKKRSSPTSADALSRWLTRKSPTTSPIRAF